MLYIADFFQFGLVLICLAGLALATQRIAPKIPFALHFCLAPLYILAVLYFLEHFIALGKPQWLWIPLTYGSLWLIHKNTFYKTLSEPVISYFLIGFFCCLFWRFTYPDLIPQSDTLRDLCFLICAGQGHGQPMDDFWVAGSKLDTYYVFQFYGGAWVYRIFGCSYGMAYAIADCVIVGFTTGAIGVGVEIFTRSKLLSTLNAIFFCMGGNGAALVVPFMEKSPGYIAIIRFIGSYAMPPHPGDAPHLNQFGDWLIHLIGISDQVETPMFYSGYYLFIGDFHPPLMGFLLLAYTMMALFYSERTETKSPVDRLCTFVMVSTPFFLVISNPWTAPLQAIFLFSWLAYRWLMGRGISFKELFIHFAGSFFLVAPPFVIYSLSYHLSVGFGLDTHRPPFLDWLLVMFPSVVCGVLLIFVLTTPTARLIFFVGLVTAVLTGFCRVEDSSGTFELFNTSLKTWPWVYQWLVMGALTCLYRSRILTAIALVPIFLALTGVVYVFGNYCLNNPPKHIGLMGGSAWITDDSYEGALLAGLRAFPQGVLIESDPEVYTPALVFTTFSTNYSVSGAPWQELEKRKDRDDLGLDAQKIKSFYHNELPDPAGWLAGVVPGGVNYIVWLDRDNKGATGPVTNLWTLINDRIKQDYDWHAVYSGPTSDPTAPNANPIGFLGPQDFPLAAKR